MSNILALETSSPLLSVALKVGDQPVQESVLEGFLTHAENLLPMTSALLKEASLSLNDVDIFLINRGPGSFTGLRIGFATLKGILVVRKPECWGALSLDIIASQVAGKEGQSLAVCLDARRERLYFKKYQYEKGTWETEGNIEVMTLEETQGRLEGIDFVTGDALGRYRESFLDSHKKIHLLGKEEWYPRASTMISFYTNQNRRGEVTSPLLQKLEKPTDLLPFYIRPSEPEEKLSKNANRC